MESMTETKPVPISVMLPPDQWQAIRRQAIAERRSASSIVRDLVDAHLKSDRKARKRVHTTT